MGFPNQEASQARRRRQDCKYIPFTTLTSVVLPRLFLVASPTCIESERESLPKLHQNVHLLTCCAIGRTAQSITQAQHPELRMLQQPTNSVPRPTRVLSMQAFVLSTDLASLVANGKRAASHSRASQVSSGRSLAGQHHRKSGPKGRQGILHRETAARRTRTTARWQVRRVKRAMLVPTLNWGAVLATMPAHQHHLLFHPHLRQLLLLLQLLHEHFRIRYWVDIPGSLYQHIFQSLLVRYLHPWLVRASEASVRFGK